MKYKVPVSWQMYGHVTVEADTLEHAAKIAESDMGIGLPDNGEYVEASWKWIGQYWRTQLCKDYTEFN